MAQNDSPLKKQVKAPEPPRHFSYQLDMGIHPVALARFSAACRGVYLSPLDEIPKAKEAGSAPLPAIVPSPPVQPKRPISAPRVAAPASIPKAPPPTPKAAGVQKAPVTAKPPIPQPGASAEAQRTIKPPMVPSAPRQKLSYERAVAVFKRRFGIGAPKAPKPEMPPAEPKPAEPPLYGMEKPESFEPTKRLPPTLTLTSGVPLPLPNVAVRPELEKLLNEAYPRKDPFGDEIERNILIRRVARTILIYGGMEGKEVFRDQLTQFICTKFTRFEGREIGDTHPAYRAAVDEIRKAYSDERLVALAVGIVDEHYKPKLVQPKTPQKDMAALLASLSEDERELVTVALGGVPCNSSSLSGFMNMHPGLRELRISNYISSFWSHPSWRQLLERYSIVRETLSARLNLVAPTPGEKYQALTNPSELSFFQKEVITSRMGISIDKFTAKEVAGFAAWALEPDNQHEVLSLWRKERLDTLTLGSLAHKLRYNQDNYTREEVSLLHRVLEKGEQLSSKTEESLRKALITKTSSMSGAHRYHPQLMKLYSTSNLMGFDSLKGAAQMQSEWDTVVEFIGLPVEKANVKLVTNNSTVLAKKTKDGSYAKLSEDCALSLVIRTPEGPALLDAVFDGIGGHGGGAKASAIARSVLEISAFAGWIKTPEDVRRALITADLAITLEQLAEKDERDDMKNDRRTNNMGSTAVVAFQQKEWLHIVHCGDSECRVIRNGSIIFKTQSHSFEYDLRTQRAPVDSPELQEMIRNNENVITSGLGSSLNYLPINNAHTSHTGIWVMPGDIIALDSDGVNDPVCGDHEYPILIKEARGDLVKARDAIIQLADSRAPGLQKTRCSELGVACGINNLRDGKNDDKSLILRYADEGFEQ